MRVPIPAVILLVLLCVGGVWWGKTRHMDFMTPPTEARLKEIRMKAEASFPQVDRLDDAISVPAQVAAPAPPPIAEPEFDLGDLTTPPTLGSYRALAPKGAAHLVELATRLEAAGHFQRALLAWERVIDSAKPDDSQAAAAVSAIKRLRPTLPDWNPDLAAATAVTLHAGTGRTLAKELLPVLESAAQEIEHVSSGIVAVKAKVAAGKTDMARNGPTPVALWLTGPDKMATSTEVLSFTVAPPESLREDTLRTVFTLVRNHLGRSTHSTAPAELGDAEDPLEALHYRVTRLCWSEFATALNQPPKKED